MILRPEDAIKRPCPFARTFSEKHGGNCEADDCLMWRWLAPPASDPAFQSAIKREMACIAQERGAKNAAGFHKQAVKNVMRDPEAYGVDLKPKRGWCGLAGKPEC